MTRVHGASLWNGVLVAITTPFGADGAIDRAALIHHARWLSDRGIDGIIVGGSLGEGGSLSLEERTSLVTDLAAELPDRIPVIAAVAGLTTASAVDQARRAAAVGARGLLVLPPYVYHGDRRETSAHFSTVFRSTALPCMLYNNPPAYGTDVGPEQVLELATDHPTFTGLKESSGDVRRITALRALLGDRIDVAVGVDDAILEGLRAGAVGWVAGLANALPDESVALFAAGRAGDESRALELYRWFLPLLRMDVGPKFVQQIKLVAAEMGVGTARVRPPRLELDDAERETTLQTLRECLSRRPARSGAPGPRE
ncbi:MAG: dihydrodipicolinate synthase family protein [Thermoplasmata archaeon]|nr:dihydrodipicolinate synthase family protein [Thermoplasmata archaeon]